VEVEEEGKRRKLRGNEVRCARGTTRKEDGKGVQS
jgi:hypothetical protein